MNKLIASVHKITTKEKFIHWIEDLPYHTPLKRLDNLLESVKDADYIVWCDKSGFNIW